MPALTIQQAFDLAVGHHRAGRWGEAESLYQQILAVQPGHAEVLHLAGLLALQNGREEIAEQRIRDSLAIEPGNARAHYDLGNLLKARGHTEAAIAAYRQAVLLQPDAGEAEVNLGNALRERGLLEEAVAHCRRGAEILVNSALAHYNLAVALQTQGAWSEAITAYRRAIELQPNFPLAHNNLGNTLRAARLLSEAIVSYEQAIRLQPDYADAWHNLGAALTHQGKLDEALAALNRAIELRPELREAMKIRGGLFQERGELDAAIAAYRHVLRLDPGDTALQSCLLFALQLHPAWDSRALAAEREAWNRRLSGLRETSVFSRPSDDPERRLRVGYVSPDFRNHVLGRNLVPLFRSSDPAFTEIFCYSGVIEPDELTDQIRQMAHQWRSTVNVADAEVVEMIRQDGIDILVDLALHTTGNRLPVLARGAAPVQVSFAGYPESTGLEAIGWRISDRWLEAAGAAEIEDRRSEIGRKGKDAERSASTPYQEKVFLLDSFWCYDPCGMDVAVNELPAKENGVVTFGSLNGFSKVNDSVLKLWARVLGRVQGSRLILLSGLGSHRQRTVEFLEREGVEPVRVEFVAPCPREEYLKLYHRLDVVLDPFPYGGHTTSLDALWMGVPVVSLTGERAVSRAGLSILNNLGLPELVAFSEEEYVRIAVSLAGNLPRLTVLRRTLRARMEGSVLMDGARFARQIEAAYRAMWRRGQRRMKDEG